jgi:hypothetical protein
VDVAGSGMAVTLPSIASLGAAPAHANDLYKIGANKLGVTRRTEGADDRILPTCRGWRNCRLLDDSSVRDKWR